MKLLLENWREYLKEMVEPITTLRIFDFDETIAHTQSETRVWLPGSSRNEKPDETLKNQTDFEEFMAKQQVGKDIDSFDPVEDLIKMGYTIDLSDYSIVKMPEEITIVTDVMREFPEDSKTYIITARRGESIDPILDYLNNINIDSSKVRPIATQGESKGDVMVQMMKNKIMPNGKSNINKIEYFEDSQRNIDDVLMKICNNPDLANIKPDGFKLIIHRIYKPKSEDGFAEEIITC